MTVQRELIPSVSPSPWPGKRGHYVAALQTKPGELNALGHAALSTWEGMTPLVEIQGPPRKITKARPLKSPTVRGWVKKVAVAVGKHPIFLDVIRLAPNAPTEVGKRVMPALELIFEAARKRGLIFVPVLWLGESSAKHIDIVGEAAAADGRGICVRYRPRRVVPQTGKTTESLVEELLGAAGCDIEIADLILDLEYIDPEDELEAEDIAPDLKDATAIGSWRSITVLGSAMPKTLKRVKENTVGTIERLEWELWKALDESGAAPETSYGDYAVQHPEPPAGGGGIMRANIRYTAATETVIARGVSMLEEGSEQYTRLCQDLIARPEWDGRSYSWGDAMIEDCATGETEPGGKDAWRGAGTSHHLRKVTEQLGERQPS